MQIVMAPSNACFHDVLRVSPVVSRPMRGSLENHSTGAVVRTLAKTPEKLSRAPERCVGRKTTGAMVKVECTKPL